MFTVTINFQQEGLKPVILKNVEPGQSLLELFLGNNIPLNHECGGICACSTCHLYVNRGNNHFEECSIREEHFLERAANLEPNSRLACQCIILDDEGEVEVTVPHPPKQVLT